MTAFPSWKPPRSVCKSCDSECKGLKTRFDVALCCLSLSLARPPSLSLRLSFTRHEGAPLFVFTSLHFAGEEFTVVNPRQGAPFPS